jgi:hypothetical protein
MCLFRIKRPSSASVANAWAFLESNVLHLQALQMHGPSAAAEASKRMYPKSSHLMKSVQFEKENMAKEHTSW